MSQPTKLSQIAASAPGATARAWPAGVLSDTFGRACAPVRTCLQPMRLLIGGFVAAAFVLAPDMLAQATAQGAPPNRCPESPELRSLYQSTTTLRASFIADRVVHENKETWGLRERVCLD